MKYVFSVVLIILILTLTFIEKITGDIKELFIAGTTYAFYDIVSTNVIVKSIIAFIVISFWVLWIRCRKNKYLITFLFTLCIWILSGRTIAFNPDTGTIKSGWFYFNTKNYEICEEDENCGEELYKKATFKRKLFWNIEVKYLNNSESIFITPFIWNKTIILLNRYNPSINQ